MKSSIKKIFLNFAVLSSMFLTTSSCNKLFDLKPEETLTKDQVYRNLYDADAAIIQHNPPRKKYKGLEDYPALIPDLKDEVALIKIYGAPTVAITINTHKMTDKEARDYAAAKEKELGMPVILPLEDGVARLIPIFKDMIEKSIAQV